MRRFVPHLPALIALLTMGAVSLTSFPDLSVAAKGICAFSALGSVVVALVAQRPEIRAHGAVSLASAAMVAAGQTPKAVAYMALTVPFVVACLVTLRLPRLPEEDRRARARRDGGAPSSSPRGRRAGLLAMILATCAAAALVAAIPPAARWAEARVDEFLQGRIELQHTVGFSDRLRLGYSARMLQSDRIVLHVEGEAPELLAGAVYDVYDGDLWFTSHESEEPAKVEAPADFVPTSRVMLARSARVPRGGQTRFFVPRGTCRFASPTGRAAVDGNGIPRPTTKDDALDVAVLAPGKDPRCEPALAPRPPGPVDVRVPKHLEAPLARIAASWLAERPEATPKETVELFARRLRSFSYSLSVKRPRNVDPVIDLLTAHPEGHCEMFSAALVLLARTRGVPARVITGYRVSEVNPISGYAVVRERNAHAWAEVFLDGHWTTVDPTPAAEMASKPRPGWGDQVLDALGTWLERAWTRISRIDPVSAGLTFVALGLAFLGARRAIDALRRRRGRTATKATSAALSSYDDLERALARAGVARKASEPIERFAERVASGSEPWAEGAAEAIRAYARLSYGGLGAESELAAALGSLASRVAGVARDAKA